MSRGRAPMVVAFAALAVGVILALECRAELWIAVTIFCISILNVIIVARGATIFIAFAALGFMLNTMEQSRTVSTPLKQRDIVALCLEVEGGNWTRLREWYSLDGEWHQSGAKIYTSCDSGVQIKGGDVIITSSRLSPITEPRNNFERFVYNQGGRGYIRLCEDEIVEHNTSRATLHHRLHATAMERLDRLSLSPDAKALSQASTLGYRTEIRAELSTSYLNSGAQHLLAISGLHIGIVVTLAMLIFAPLALITHGQVWRYAAVILSIWAFILCTTMPVSVIRSGIMITILLISRSWSLRYAPLNVLAATALFITIFDTHALFNIGFQLSFIAVAAILIVSPALKRWCKGIPQPLKIIVELLAISTIATAALTPIISYTFGSIVPISPITTLLILPLLYITIATSALWIIAPLPLWSPLAESIIEWSCRAQVYITATVSRWEISRFNFSAPRWSVILFYLAAVVIYLIIVRRNRKK